MLTRNPFYPLYDSNGYYHSPSYNDRFYYQQMKQREAEAVRRAEMQRYQKHKEVEDRRSKAAIRRLEMEEEENLRKAEIQRMKEAKLYQRHLDLKRQRRQQDEVNRRATIARSQKQQQEKVEGKQWTLLRGLDGRLYRVALKNKDETDSDSEETVPISNKCMAAPSEVFKPVVQSSPIREIPKKKRSRKVTVLVEDASDDESEHDSFKSVWHNRRPSPGQWMEPVDF